MKWGGESLNLHQPSKIRQDPCRIFLRLGKPSAFSGGGTSRKRAKPAKAVTP